MTICGSGTKESISQIAVAHGWRGLQSTLLFVSQFLTIITLDSFPYDICQDPDIPGYRDTPIPPPVPLDSDYP